MVTECEKFAAKYNMKFSTNVEARKSKTKAIIFTKNERDLAGVSRVVLNNDKLPWVDEIKHVGNLMEIDNSFSHDIKVKRGAFIGRIHSLNQEFYYASGEVKTRLYDIFSLSFYGSSLWDLFGEEVARIHRSYNVAIRMAFNVPRETRTFLIEPLQSSVQVSSPPHSSM